MISRETLAETITRLRLATDKESTHSYCTRFYEKALALYRDRPGVWLVEIGVDYGASLVMWAEWFGSALIFGADRKIPVGCAAGYPAIQTWQGNVYSDEGKAAIPETDILIDDGPHTLLTQKWTVEHLLPKVRPGGLLVIEDIQDPAYIEPLLAAVPESLRPFAGAVDLRNVKGRHDDLLFVVVVPEAE